MASHTLVYHERIQFTNPQTSPQSRTIPFATKDGSTYVVATVRDNRAGAARGATVRRSDATHVEIEWDGVLAGGETITVSYFVFDTNALGNDILEILFRLERTLGILGENAIQDLVVYNKAGVMTSYRLRLFDSKVNAQAAEIDDLGGLDTGERARISITKDVTIGENNILSLVLVRDEKIATPGVD
jgi:hypothetical protein